MIVSPVQDGFRAIVRLDRMPWITLAVALAAAAVFLAGAEPLMIYDRSRVLGGEVWRLWTGNLVHFGALHALVDIGLLVVLGCVLEWRYRRFVVLSLLILPVAVTGTVLLVDPGMATYGGLSGLNFGWLVFLALRGWQRAWTDWFWPAVLLLYIAEVIQEAWLGHGMVRFDDASIVVATWAHVGGGVAAVLMYLGLRPGRTTSGGMSAGSTRGRRARRVDRVGHSQGNRRRIGLMHRAWLFSEVDARCRENAPPVRLSCEAR